MTDNSTVLVTGAAGFIGAFLCKRLVEEGGFRVVGLDNLNDYYDPALKHVRLAMVREADADGLFTFVEADLCDEGALQAVFDECRPSTVVNLAAQAGVRHSIEHPRDYIDSNVLGFFNVLELCRSHEVGHLVFASSSSVYGDADELPLSEDAACNEPVSLYAATKKADELMAHAYAKLYGTPCTGLRFFTVYGPLGRPDMAYYSFARAMADGETIRLFNNGEMLRDFTYVDDIVEGLRRVIEQGCKPEGDVPYRIFNIGHGDPVVLGDFVRELEDALREEGVLEGEVSYELVEMQPGDVHQTSADTAALQEAYGYRAATPLSEGIRAFARWFAAWSE